MTLIEAIQKLEAAKFDRRKTILHEKANSDFKLLVFKRPIKVYRTRDDRRFKREMYAVRWSAKTNWLAFEAEDGYGKAVFYTLEEAGVDAAEWVNQIILQGSTSSK